MAKPRTLKAFRQNLILSTALIGGVVGMSNAAQAQVLPDPTGATIVTGGTSGGAPGANNPVFSVSPSGLTETVNLRDNRTIINWMNNFVVSGGYGIEFKDDRASVAGLSGLTDNIAVLNRDLSGTRSAIYGSLTSDANVAVYLINANGILFGPGSSVNAGSFFGSVHDITSDADFINGSALRFGVSGTGAIELQGPASITTTATGSTNGGRLGDLVLIGASIAGQAQSTLTATGGDVALVAADDVTVATGAGSPLALTINKGTAVSGAFTVSGTVSGRNVTMALATRGSVADAVLNVGGMVTATGAAVTDHGIVLTAGAAGAGVTLGAVPSTVPGSDIDAAGSVAVTGTLDSRRAIGINALQGISTTLGATADGAISLASDGTLGIAALTAGGPITVSGTGTKTFSGTLRTTSAGAAGLVSVDGGGAASFTAANSITSAGGVALGQTSVLGSLDAKQITAVGDIRAHVFGGSTITGLNAGGVGALESTIGGFTLGTVTTGGNFTVAAINGLSAITGDVTVTGDIGVDAGGLTLGTAGTAVTQQATGSVSLRTVGSDLNAIGGLTLRSNSDGMGSEALTLSSAGAIGFGSAALAGGTARQSDVQIRTASSNGAVALGQVDAKALLGAVGADAFANGLTRTAQLSLGAVTLTDALALSGTSVTTGAIVTGGAATLTATNGGITTGAVDATGALTATATGAVSVGSTGGTIKASAVDVTGGSVTTLGAITTGALTLHATSGALAVTGPSTVADTIKLMADADTASVTGAVTANGDFNVTGTGVTLGATGATVLQQARGAITVRATGAPGITGLGTLTLLSNLDPAYDFGMMRGITLRADSGNIAFAPTTNLRASTAQLSDVTIIAGSPTATVALGAVSARDLLGLSARQASVTLGNVALIGGLDVRTTAGMISTGAVDTVGPILLRTNAGDVATGALTSTNGAVTAQASGTLTSGAVSGRFGVDLRAGGTLAAGNVTASAGSLVLRSTAGTVTAGVTSASGTAMVDGDLGVTLGSIRTDVGAITLDAAHGAISVGGAVDAGAELTVTARDAVGAGSLRGRTLLVSGQSVTATSAASTAGFARLTGTNGNVAIGTATASGGSLTLTTMGTGSVLLGTGTATVNATIDAARDARVDSLTASSGDVTVTAGGSITGRALGSAINDGRFDPNFGRADLIAGSNVAATAGMGNTLAQLGNVTHSPSGTGTVTADAVDVRGLGIDLNTATARVGALSLVATNLGLTLGTGSAGTTARLEQQGSTGELVANTLTAGTTVGSVGDVTIIAGTSARLGTVSTATGGIAVSANGSITGLALGAPINDGRGASGYGRAVLSGVGTISAVAPTLIQLGALTGGDICINGNAGCTDPMLASTSIDIDGAVTATGKFFAGGSNIQLGVSGAAQTMRANGSVRLVASNGSIRGGNGLTLTSDADGAGSEAMTLDAAGAGGIVFGAGSTLQGGPARTSAIGIRLGAAGAPLTLGTVNARSLGGVNAAGTVFGALSTTGPVTLGTVSVRDTLSITSTQGITTGAVSVTGAGQGLTLDSGANLTATGALSSQGALYLGADGNLNFTTATSAAGGATIDVLGNAQGSLVSAAGDILENVGGADTIVDTITSNGAVTILAGSATKNSAVATGTLSVTTQSGAVSLASGSAGSTATIASATDARLGTVQSTGGNVIVSTGATSAVTGLLLSGPINDGRPAPAYGRANLLAAGAVSVNAGSLAQLGLVTHGTGVTDTANVSADAVDVAAATIDLTNATARAGALALTATAGQLTLVNGSAGPTAIGTATITKSGTTGGVSVGTLGAGGLVTISSSTGAQLGMITSTGSDVIVGAAGMVTASSFTAGGTVRVTTTGDAAITDAVSAGGDYVVTARSVALGVDPAVDMDPETQSAGGRVVITATGGTIRGGAGLTLRSNAGGVADAGNARTLNLDATGGNIAFDLTSVLQGGTARQSAVGINLRSPNALLTLGTVRASALTAVNAALTNYTLPLTTSGDIVLGDVSTTQALDVRTTAGSIRAGTIGAASINLDASGAVTGLAGVSTGTTDLSFGRAMLSAGSNVSVSAGTLAQFGGIGAGGNVTVMASEIDGLTADAGTGALSLTANGRWLRLVSGTAGTTATLLKTGAFGDLVAGTIVSGFVVGSNGTATIQSSTNARLASVTSRTGDIGVTAVGDVTGLPGAPIASLVSTGIASGFGRTDLSAMMAGRSITVGAGGLVQLGTATAPQNVTINAGTGIDAITTTATAGSLALTTLSGPLFLDTGTSGLTATLDKRGAGSEVRVRTLNAGGNATVTSSTDARIGSVTSTTGNIAVTATNSATGLAGAPAGTLDPNFGRAALSATAAGRDVTVSVGTVLGAIAQLGTVQAGRNVSVTGGATDISSATAGTGSLGITSTAGALLLGSGSAGTTATLLKQGTTSGELVAGSLTAGTAAGSTGTATLTSATNARIGSVTSQTGDVVVAASNGAVTGLAGTSTGTTDTAFGRANLAAASGRDTTVTAGTLAQLGTVTAGRNVGVTANVADITTATATTGSLGITANTGALTLGTGSAGTTATLTKQGSAGALTLTSLTSGTVSGSTGTAMITSATDARIGSATARTGNMTVSATGAVTGLLGGAPAGGLDPTYGRANLAALGPLASIGVTAGTIAQIGTGSADGSFTLGAASIDATSLTATNGALLVIAGSGQLTLGTGSAGTTARVEKNGTAGGLELGTLTSGTVGGSTGTATIKSATDARIGSATARTGNLDVTVTNALTGLSGATPAGGLDARFGRANLVASAAGSATTVTAGTQAQIGTGSAGQTLSVTVTAGSIDATVLTAATGALSATATAGNLTLGRGGGATTTTLSTTGLATLGAGGTVYAGVDGAGAAVSGDLTLEASGADLRGTVKGFNVTITVRDRPPVGNAVVANTLALGGATLVDAAAAAATDAAAFDLRADELNRIDATNLTFNTAFGGTARDVRLGTVALGSAVGRTRLDILSLGTIAVNGTFSAPTAGRTLRLGGTNAPNTIDRAAAIQIVTTPNVTSGGSIVADVLDLRGTQIVGGQLSLLNTLAVSGTDVTALVSNPNSILYNAAANAGDTRVAENLRGTAYTGSNSVDIVNRGTAPIFLTARTLSLNYGQYALFQNTGANGDTGGVNIGELRGPSLSLTSTGASGVNAFALFGRIGVVNGPVATGRAAALLGPTSIDYTTSANPRINPNTSRINGCLIGSGGGGCLITNVVTPPPVFFDLAQTSILTTATDLALAFDPLVGTSNEALFSDLGTIDLFSNEQAPCPPGSTGDNCRKSGAPK